jgi:hypothetical protein
MESPRRSADGVNFNSEQHDVAKYKDVPEDKIYSVFQKLCIAELMELSNSSTSKINFTATKVLTENLQSYVQDEDLDDEIKAVVLARFYNNYNFLTDDGNGMLLLIDYGYTDIIERLLKTHSINPAAGNHIALREAVRNQNEKLVQLLLEDGVCDPQNSNSHAFFHACAYGSNPKIVQLLLHDGRSDFNYQRRIGWAGPQRPINIDVTPFSMAACNDNKDTFKILLNSPHIDPGAHHNIALCNALREGKVENAKILIKDRRIDPSQPDNKALAIASEMGLIDVVMLLLKDIRVHAADKAGNAARGVPDDKRFVTECALAKAKGHHEVAENLQYAPDIVRLP